MHFALLAEVNKQMFMITVLLLLTEFLLNVTFFKSLRLVEHWNRFPMEAEESQSVERAQTWLVWP